MEEESEKARETIIQNEKERLAKFDDKDIGRALSTRGDAEHCKGWVNEMVDTFVYHLMEDCYFLWEASPVPSTGLPKIFVNPDRWERKDLQEKLEKFTEKLLTEQVTGTNLLEYSCELLFHSCVRREPNDQFFCNSFGYIALVFVLQAIHCVNPEELALLGMDPQGRKLPFLLLDYHQQVLVREHHVHIYYRIHQHELIMNQLKEFTPIQIILFFDVLCSLKQRWQLDDFLEDLTNERTELDEITRKLIEHVHNDRG